MAEHSVFVRFACNPDRFAIGIYVGSGFVPTGYTVFKRYLIQPDGRTVGCNKASVSPYGMVIPGTVGTTGGNEYELVTVFQVYYERFGFIFRFHPFGYDGHSRLLQLRA